MNELDEKMLELRKSTAQGGDIQGRSKSDQIKDASPEFLRRIESSVAYPTSDPSTGKSESEGEAYPQTEHHLGFEALLSKVAKAMEPEQDESKPKALSPTPVTTVKPKSRSDAPTSKKRRVTPPPPTGIDDTGDFGDDTGEPTFDPLTVNEQGVILNEAVAKDHGEKLSDDDIFDILDQHEKTIRKGLNDRDREVAAAIDLGRAEEGGQEIWSGDGPGGEGELSFWEDPDGGDPKGFIVYDDGVVQVVTGMLFPPRTN